MKTGFPMRGCQLGLLVGCLLAGCMQGSHAADVSDGSKPNIVFIAIDDLNDWIGCLGGHPDAKTPCIDRLAQRGLLFRNAHCQVPVCMASRVSVFSGKLASTTGCYEFNAEFHEAPTLVDSVPIPMLFKQNGYLTLGGGKLLHSGFKGRIAGSFDVALKTGGNPTPTERLNWPVKVWDYGAFPERDEEMGDYQLAQQAARYLSDKHAEPFFIACGFHRPHVPLHVPQKWFDLFDRNQLKLPQVPLEDMDDIPASDITRQQAIAPSHAEVLKADKWRDFVHAYMACISFVDHCVGVVADAALHGPNKENTIVVLWSDHGFHLGEKQHWAKRTLWAESTRTPLIFAGMDIAAGRVCDASVGLIDIYPTLTQIADLPTPAGLDGKSLLPLIVDPKIPWDSSAISTWLPNNHSVVNQHWRYIRYADGAEELYDHRNDAEEFRNLASVAEYAEIKKQLAQRLPQVNVPAVVISKSKRKSD